MFEDIVQPALMLTIPPLTHPAVQAVLWVVGASNSPAERLVHVLTTTAGAIAVSWMIQQLLGESFLERTQKICLLAIPIFTHLLLNAYADFTLTSSGTALGPVLQLSSMMLLAYSLHQMYQTKVLSEKVVREPAPTITRRSQTTSKKAAFRLKTHPSRTLPPRLQRRNVH